MWVEYHLESWTQVVTISVDQKKLNNLVHRVQDTQDATKLSYLPKYRTFFVFDLVQLVEYHFYLNERLFLVTSEKLAAQGVALQ